jgi:hypothetical protein
MNLKQYSYYPTVENAVYLGPGQVIEIENNRVRLALQEEEAWALLAMPYPYQPQVGDVVLAISQGEAYYVIGVIKGSGLTTFTVPGDLRFQAPNGKIDLVSTKGISILGPQVKIHADSLELHAKTIVEKFVNAYRWVKDAFQLRAGRVRTIVESSYRVKAEKIVERAKTTVHIDGEKIHLG